MATELNLENPSPLVKLLLKLDPGINFLVVTLIKFAVAILNFFLRRLFFYSTTEGPYEEEVLSKHDYTKSAHVVDVYLRGCFTFVQTVELNNYLYRHVRYGNPEEEILGNDQATLMSITSDGQAIFCVMDSDVYNTEKFPFIYISQFFFARRLIVVPLASLHRMSAKVGDPDKRVTLINMTGRCGSTLLCQMLQRVPRTRIIAESYAFFNIHRFYLENRYSEPEYKRLVQSVMRLQCKPETSKERKYDHIIVKMPALFNASQFDTFKEVFPKFTYFYVTRNMRDVYKSYIKCYWASMSFIYRQFGPLRRDFPSALPVPYNDVNWRDRINAFVRDRLYTCEDEELMALVYVCSISYFLRNKQDYLKIMIYEDFMADPEGEFTDLLRKLKLPTDNVSHCLGAMKRDSQRGIFGARGNNTVTLTKDHWRMFDNMLADCNIPLNSNMSFEEFKRVIMSADQA